jgi:hypothetical protein
MAWDPAFWFITPERRVLFETAAEIVEHFTNISLSNSTWKIKFPLKNCGTHREP